MDRTLFPKLRFSSAPRSKPESGENRWTGAQEPVSLQKEFLGLRLSLEVAVRLKKIAVVGEGSGPLSVKTSENEGRSNQRADSGGPRALQGEEALELMAEIWTHGRGFVRCLARHVEGK